MTDEHEHQELPDEDVQWSDDDSDSESFLEQYLFRPDGFWYNNAYDVLPAFACQLKAKNLSEGLRSKLPDDICERIGSFADVDDPVWGLKRLDAAERSSAYILNVLEERMKALQRRHPGCVHSADPYMNVINYFEALRPNFLEQQNDAYLLDNVLPWLGLTDWNSTSGSRRTPPHWGRTRQMVKFKSTLKRYLKRRSAAEAAKAAAPLSQAARASHFGFPLTKWKKGGGKRSNRRKLRKRKSKRTCKRRH
jgi:hypothetical protein